MALIWTDGFDRYSANADFALCYTVSGTPVFNATGGAFNNGGNVRVNTTFACLTRTSAPFPVSMTAGGVFHVAFIFKANSLPAGRNIFNLGTNVFGNNDGREPKIYLNSAGALSVNKTGSFGTEFSSANGAIAAGTYYWIEWRAKYNTFANGGYIKIYVNGNIVLDTTLTSGDAVTDLGAVPTTWTGIQFPVPNNNGVDQVFDDVIVWDETGTDFTLTQISASYLPVIETLAVDGDDAVQFTPLSGTNASNVDETGFHDGNTTYNKSNTIGHVDQFTLADPGTTPGYVFAVAQKTVARVDSPGIANMRSRIISGATTVESANRLMTTSYVLWWDPYGKDPNTSAVWAVAQPASIKIGYEYQS